MSIEVVLFIIVGLVALFSARMMVAVTNAIHSALYLVLNFACVALLYLMLDAPFLALVQIAVYAGAIMVLFLFVIMLLGAERTLEELRQFKWLAPVVMILSITFFILIFFVMDRGDIDSQPVPPSSPLVRVVNTLPDFQNADFYLNGELFIEAVPFGGTTGQTANFKALSSGEYTLAVTQAGAETRPLPLGSFTVSPNHVVTLVAYGMIGSDIRPTLMEIPEDIAYYTEKGGRTVIANALSVAPVSVVDAGSDHVLSAGESARAPMIASNLAGGEATAMTLERTGNKNWVFVETANGQPTDTIIARPSTSFNVQQGTTNLFILANDRDGDLLVPVVIGVTTRTLPQFGSAEALGSVLFTDYLLPFQMVAILLLAAMVGAIVLTQRGDVKPKPGRPTRRKVSRPLTSVIASQTGHSVLTVEDAGETPDVEAHVVDDE